MTHEEWFITSRLFKNDTFKKPLFKRWGIEYDGKIECKFGIHRDQKGFFQDPHTDVKEYAKEIITMQVKFIHIDRSLIALGLSFVNFHMQTQLANPNQLLFYNLSQKTMMMLMSFLTTMNAFMLFQNDDAVRSVTILS